MSDSDALMWHIEKDPLLRSTITVVWWLDAAPDRDRLEDKIERATRQIPRLRQRVVSNPYSIAPPRWEVDPHFDRKFHVRWLDAPAGGGVRSVLDCAEPIAMQGVDRARPLWELYVVGGLAGGRAALVLKLHHSLSDGVGLVRMTAALVEHSREPEPTPGPLPALPAGRVLTQPERVVDALGHSGSSLGRARAPRRAPRDSAFPWACVPSTPPRSGRLLRPAPHSAPSASARTACSAHRARGSPEGGGPARAARKANDAFVAGVAGGLAVSPGARSRCA